MSSSLTSWATHHDSLTRQQHEAKHYPSPCRHLSCSPSCKSCTSTKICRFGSTRRHRESYASCASGTVSGAPAVFQSQDQYWSSRAFSTTWRLHHFQPIRSCSQASWHQRYVDSCSERPMRVLLLWWVVASEGVLDRRLVPKDRLHWPLLGKRHSDLRWWSLILLWLK